MNRNVKTSCDVCGRGTETGRARHVPTHRLDEPNSYTICTRSNCDILGRRVQWWLNDNEDVDWLTFEEILETIDDSLLAKQKFTPTWERPSIRSLPGEQSYINDFTEVTEDAE